MLRLPTSVRSFTKKSGLFSKSLQICAALAIVAALGTGLLTSVFADDDPPPPGWPKDGVTTPTPTPTPDPGDGGYSLVGPLSGMPFFIDRHGAMVVLASTAKVQSSAVVKSGHQGHSVVQK